MVEIRIQRLKDKIEDSLGKELRSRLYDEFVKDVYAFDKFKKDVLKIDEITQELTEMCCKGYSDHHITESVTALCLSKIEEALWPSKDILKRLKEELNELRDIIIFIGAGVSLEADLGWHTTNGVLRQTLTNEKYSLEEIEKEILEKNGERCWNELRVDKGKRIKFQTIFTNAIRNKTPSESHYYLASLFKCGIIKHLVCFNWDNLIEKAYGNPEPSIAYLNQRGDNKSFWKPHGCVKCSADHKWIFPPEVKMNSYFEEYVQGAIKGKKVGLVLSCGFSGNNDFTKSYLEGLFGGCSFYDIRPDILKERELGNSIYMSSSRVLKEIISELDLEFNFFESLLQQQNINQKTLESIKRDGELFLKERENRELISEVHQQTVIQGDFTGTMIQGDYVNVGIHIQTLKEIFETLEWNSENTESIKNIERSIRSNESAIRETQSFIHDFVRANASNNSVITKLRDFANNISTSVPAGIIANAIWRALESVQI